MRKPSYAHNAGLMLVVVMPVTLVLGSVAAWLDPEESASFLQTLLNNGVALYVLMVLPGLAMSLIHTRWLLYQGAQEGKGLRSVGLGTGLGLLMPFTVFLPMSGGLFPQMWPLALWGAVTGAVYGMLALRVHAKRE